MKNNFFMPSKRVVDVFGETINFSQKIKELEEQTLNNFLSQLSEEELSVTKEFFSSPQKQKEILREEIGEEVEKMIISLARDGWRRKKREITICHFQLTEAAKRELAQRLGIEGDADDFFDLLACELLDFFSKNQWQMSWGRVFAEKGKVMAIIENCFEQFIMEDYEKSKIKKKGGL